MITTPEEYEYDLQIAWNEGYQAGLSQSGWTWRTWLVMISCWVIGSALGSMLFILLNQ